MPKFSKAFRIGKSQLELDFVDVELDRDIKLFIDPFALSQSPENWSQDCHRTLHAYFQEIVDLVRSARKVEALELLSHLGEPNETRLGLSRGRPRGNGIGDRQAEDLYDALFESTAVRTGFISSLEECELMVEGIGHDKISDLATNVVREHLVAYTKGQCDLHDLATSEVPLAPYYDATLRRWVSKRAFLPIWRGRPVILVPKSAVREFPAYNHQRYYRHYVLRYLQAEHLEAQSALVRTLRNGRRVVYKKALAEQPEYALSKEFLFEFSRNHPEVLRKYREQLEKLERSAGADTAREEEAVIAEALSVALRNIRSGSASASKYHELMIGIAEFLFYPHLVHPKKEVKIHGGRKRIDIVMENAATRGIFHRLHDVRRLPCPYVVIECKNYTGEIANPELDQLSGRFGVNRGQLGLLCCRRFDDRVTFVKRCMDTHRDGRGLILPIDDEWVVESLAVVEAGNRARLDKRISELVTEVWYS